LAAMGMAARLATPLLLATSALGQFPGGGPGGNAWNPPAPVCAPFKCKSGEVPVGRPEHKIWSYGCKEAGMNVFSMADLDPNNPLAGMNKQKHDMDKCCVEKDICKQTCGKTSKECHEQFQKCSKKSCKGNQNCQLQAFMADLMSEPVEDEADKAKKFDPEGSKCKAYTRGQSEACMCVPKGDFKSATESKLRRFYKDFNPEKLTEDGEIKDVEEVWKKWKGKEADMFMALATKYKAKAVEIREKPKPPPYTPPEEDTPATPNADMDATSDGDSASDEGASSYDRQRAELAARKRKAVEEEDYDAAQDLKTQLESLTEAELKSLKEKKAKAIESEDFLAAKKIKDRIARLSEL